MKKIISIYLIIISFQFFHSCEKKNPDKINLPPSFEWKISTPEKQGFDSEKIANALIESQYLRLINSLLVVKNGCIVIEEYYNQFDKDDAHEIYSVTKSIMSALTGIALREGYIDSLDQKIFDFFPEYTARFESGAVHDPRVFGITIRYLLTMQAGIVDYAIGVFDNEDIPDAVLKILQHPLEFSPGEHFLYSSYASHILSAILTRVTNMSTLEFADLHLFEPLHITISEWQTDPNGICRGGSGLVMTPRDMARFGYLYLQQGFLFDNRIVPEDWITESTTDQLHLNSEYGNIKALSYGYQWWLGKMGDYQIYLAIGAAGQYIINFPDINMIVVITSDSNKSNNQYPLDVLEFVEQHILASVKN